MVGKYTAIILCTVLFAPIHSQLQFFWELAAVSFGEPDPTLFMTAPEKIIYEGYKSEIHHVNSSNFRLEMHRILQGKNMSEPTKGNGTPVICIHGYGSSGDVFIMNKADRALVYKLADNGYDIWLGNVRGNKYSRITYNNMSVYHPDFWKYGFDDNVDDLGQMIDYILQVTNKTRLYLLGHSNGNALAFALFSSKPEYNTKVLGHLALAPTLFGRDPRLGPWVGFVQPMVQIAKFFLKNVNVPINLEPTPEELHSKKILFINSLIYAFSKNELGGDRYFTLDVNRIPVYQSCDSAGTTIRHALNYLESMQSLAKFNYGTLKNLQIYGEVDPPSYNLENVKVITYIFQARNDKISDEYIATLLCDRIKVCNAKFVLGSKNNGHGWFLNGNDVNQILLPKVLAVLTNRMMQ